MRCPPSSFTPPGFSPQLLHITSLAPKAVWRPFIAAPPPCLRNGGLTPAPPIRPLPQLGVKFVSVHARTHKLGR